jgi:hypothetical protein
VKIRNLEKAWFDHSSCASALQPLCARATGGSKEGKQAGPPRKRRTLAAAVKGVTFKAGCPPFVTDPDLSCRTLASHGFGIDQPTLVSS